MKLWIEWLLQNNRRRLEVSVGGKWYLAFTIVLGVVAINSGNNVIYLLESLLLSALILSGVLSEQTLTRTRISRVLSQAQVGQKTGDIILVENLGRLPLYCIEVGEWEGGKFEVISFLLILPGRAKVRIRSQQSLKQRGRHSWKNLAIATSFPYGFARKIRFMPESGSRIVWPFLQKSHEVRLISVDKRGQEQDILGGEIEEIPPYGDISRVHWPSSGRTNTLMALPRRKNSDEEEVHMEMCAPGEELEKRISIAAGGLAKFQKNAVLVIKDGTNTKKINGAWRALDFIALLPGGKA